MSRNVCASSRNIFLDVIKEENLTTQLDKQSKSKLPVVLENLRNITFILPKKQTNKQTMETQLMAGQASFYSVFYSVPALIAFGNIVSSALSE